MLLIRHVELRVGSSDREYLERSIQGRHLYAISRLVYFLLWSALHSIDLFVSFFVVSLLTLTA